MKKHLFLVLALFIGGSLFAQTQRELTQLMRDRGEYYFTLSVDDPAMLNNDLGNLCSVDGSDGRNVVCYANQKEYDKLLQLGFQPNLLTPPSLRQEAKMWEGGDRATYDWNSYLTYDQYVSMMEGFPSQAQNTGDRTCELITLGTLSTSNHRKLLGVHIYKDTPYGKPRFLYSSTMHGDEVTGMILMLRLIDELCTSNDSRILQLLNDVDIYILPLTNPDGTYAGGNNTVTGATRKNGNNIDLNRNYKDSFNGEHPDSNSYQEETQWTMAFADEHLFTMGANYHGGAEVMNYPWDWTFQDHPDMDWWEYVCTEYVTLARNIYSDYMGGYYQNSSNYDYDGVTNGATWYSITGSRQDYMNGYAQCREVTVECSETKTPSASELPSFWTYHHNCMLTLMEQSRNGVHGVVRDATTGQTIQGVTVSVLNHDIHYSYVTTHEVGDFHRPIKGGTYTFVFDKEGYKRSFVDVTVADGQRVDLNVYLTPSTASPLDYYEQVNTSSIATGPYLMGYRNGSTLIMPSHSDRSTSTTVSVSTTSLSLTPTSNGFTLPHDIDRQKIAIEPSGTSGQYHILYEGRMLSRSNSTLSWAKPSNSSGNGVSLTSYQWYVNASGVYQQSSTTKYYLYYNGSSFTTNSNQCNITFYKEYYVPEEYTVTAEANPAGSGTVQGAGTYYENQPCTLTAVPNRGWDFTKWNDDITENPLSFTVLGNASYTANFTQVPERTITLAPVTNGTIYADHTTAYKNDVITLTATPDEGYYLGGWTVTAGSQTITVTNNQFVMPDSDVTVSATFVTGFRVTLASVMNGTISATPTEGPSGREVTLTATPATGYSLDSWVVFKTTDVNTTVTVTNNKFTMPNYDVTVSAIFSKPKEEVVTIGENGTTTSSSLPTNVWYKYTTSQQIYTANELGGAGTITAIAFNYNGNATSGARTLDIYMNYTNSTTLSTWVAVTSASKVYTGTQTFTTAGWYTITLDTPFEYNGTSSVMVTVDDNTGSYIGQSGRAFYTYSTGGTRAIYNQSDSYNVTPMSPQTSSNYKATTSTSNAQMEVFKELPNTEGYLSLSSLSLDGFVSYSNRASDPQGLAILGSNLQANLTITASEGYEVSDTENGTYASSLTLAPTEGRLLQRIFVRQKSASTPGTSYSGTLTLASSTTSGTVSLNGSSYVIYKDIHGYTANAETPDYYYLIASPMGEVDPENVTNMLSPGYDLFCFKQDNMVDNMLCEWVNYDGANYENSNDGRNLKLGKGYLYANSGNVRLSFGGFPYAGDGVVTLSKVGNYRFSGWNLVGNPFAETAYIGDREFYRMNEGGTEIVAAEDAAIEPMEGIFVVAENDGETLTFSTDDSSTPGKNLVLSIVRNRGNVIDRGIVRFDNGDVLPKFQINPNNTKVYFPVDNKDYAVVNAGDSGEIPVNFKAAQNGTYTINVSMQEVDLRYLHLIDNMTGADVDLLKTPSYTFDANVTDYDSRFKLVFVADDAVNADTFAFFNNGNWIVNNDGEAVLQLIDVNGRILRSEQINGCVNKHYGYAPGVYMMRLINGNEVKTQKIVIK